MKPDRLRAPNSSPGRRWAVAAVLACALLVAATACGGHRAPSGRAVFAQECSACHTVSGHNNPRRQGGDLLGIHATRPQLRQFAREMPVRRPLTGAQLDAVVDYLAAVRKGSLAH